MGFFGSGFFDSIAAPFVSGAFSLLGGMQQNQAAADNSAQQMAFQERMSGSAHQREVADLRAAGLNPILSGTGGAGSTTPAGSAAPVVNELGNAVASAQASDRYRMEKELLEAEISNKYQDTQLKADLSFQAFKQSRLTDELVKKALQDTQNSYWDTELKSAQTNFFLNKMMLPVYETESAKANASTAWHNERLAREAVKGSILEGQIDETGYGEVMRYIKRFFGSIIGSGSSARAFGLPKSVD